jgi:hypothetical protein
VSRTASLAALDLWLVGAHLSHNETSTHARTKDFLERPLAKGLLEGLFGKKMNWQFKRSIGNSNDQFRKVVLAVGKLAQD